MILTSIPVRYRAAVAPPDIIAEPVLPRYMIELGLEGALGYFSTMRTIDRAFLRIADGRERTAHPYTDGPVHLMNVFELRNWLVANYGDFVHGFFHIQDTRIRDQVEAELKAGLLWPEPLIQLNPSFEPGAWVDELVRTGTLHEACGTIFRKDKGASESGGQGKPLRLHRHQTAALQVARAGHHYVLTTGTGSGKSLVYMIPIVDHVLRKGSGQGIQAIVVYPMNALANSQEGEFEKFLCQGYPNNQGPVTFARYTGQESNERKQEIIAKPPDILLTNYVMLELLLTRPDEKPLIQAGKGLHFLVLDELHTYRGRQGADVAMLVRRTREAFTAEQLQCVGTSATLAGSGSYDEQRAEVAGIASMIFGAAVQPEHVIGETLRRTTPDADFTDPQFVAVLRERIEDVDTAPPTDYQGFISDPLSMWIESTFGITTACHKRLCSGGREVVEWTYRGDAQTCQACPLREKCTTSKKSGRSVQRSEHEELIIAHRAWMETAEAKAVYRLRGQTIEIVFADVKEHRGLRRFSGHGLARVRAEFALEVLLHNLLVAQRLLKQKQNVEAINGKTEKIAA